MASENAIIERAEMYLRKLSCGINPLTDEILPEGDSCKQERISKCLAYVASLLQQQLNHDQVAPIVTEKAPRPAKRAPKPQMQELSIDAESLKRYRFFDYPVSISRVVRNINELLPDNMNHLLYADVANFLVQEGKTKPLDEGDFEAHRKYIDVQIILQGREEIAWADLGTLKTTEAYDEQKDKEMLGGEAEYTAMINAGTFWVALPQDAHKACKHTAAPSTYKKVVMKLPVVK